MIKRLFLFFSLIFFINFGHTFSLNNSSFFKLKKEFSKFSNKKEGKDINKKIKEVENNLMSSSALQKSQPKRNIKKQMKKYDISAVSIAFINNYSIEWAKGYGVLKKKQ